MQKETIVNVGGVVNSVGNKISIVVRIVYHTVTIPDEQRNYGIHCVILHLGASAGLLLGELGGLDECFQNPYKTHYKAGYPHH